MNVLALSFYCVKCWNISLWNAEVKFIHLFMLLDSLNIREDDGDISWSSQYWISSIYIIKAKESRIILFVILDIKIAVRINLARICLFVLQIKRVWTKTLKTNPTIPKWIISNLIQKKLQTEQQCCHNFRTWNVHSTFVIFRLSND